MHSDEKACSAKEPCGSLDEKLDRLARTTGHINGLIKSLDGALGGDHPDEAKAGIVPCIVTVESLVQTANEKLDRCAVDLESIIKRVQETSVKYRLLA